MKFSLFLLFFSFCLSSQAQIVNIENKRLTGNKQGFTGTAEVNFNYTLNTKELLQIGGNIRVDYIKKRHAFLAMGDHSFIKSTGSDFVNRGFQHLRYNYTFKDSGRVSLEAFQQSQYNKIQKINLRLLLGSGVRFKLIDLKEYQLVFGTGVMGEYEELIDNGISQDLLSTNYLSFDGQFNESIGFNTICYFQPKLFSFVRYRFSNESSIRFRINQYLSFRLIYSVTHDSRDIFEVRKTNYFVKNALQVRF